jgi:hypothetical protein
MSANQSAIKERMVSMITQELRHDIADIVRLFEFRGGLPGGNCIPRAVIGHAVMRECGLESHLVAGALLYRVGKHRQRDTLRFCLENNLGGYNDDRQLVGHVWNEYSDQLIDFSSGDWCAEAEQMYATMDQPAERALGPVEWVVPVPDFIWEPAASLKAAWQRRGQPRLGEMWYGGWVGRCPDYASFDGVVANAMPDIRRNVALLRVRARIEEQQDAEKDD